MNIFSITITKNTIQDHLFNIFSAFKLAGYSNFLIFLSEGGGRGMIFWENNLIQCNNICAMERGYVGYEPLLISNGIRKNSADICHKPKLYDSTVIDMTFLGGKDWLHFSQTIAHTLPRTTFVMNWSNPAPTVPTYVPMPSHWFSTPLCE